VEEARAFTDRDGKNRASLEVTAQLVKFLSGTNAGSETHAEGGNGQDEDIPF